MDYELKRPIELLFNAGNQFEKYSHVESNLTLGDLRTKAADITVIIPTYRRPAQLLDAIQSVVNQTIDISKYEILVVDNDNDQESASLDEVRNLKIENLFYYQNSQNLGAIGNWNRGFKLARSKWVCMLHDDDILYPYALKVIESMIQTLDDERIAAVSPSFHFARHKNGEWVINPPKSLHFWRKPLQDRLVQRSLKRLQLGLRDDPVAPTCGALFRRQAVIDAGGFPDDYKSDDLFFIYALSTKYICFSTKQVWGQYRWGNNDSLSETTLAELLKETLLLYDYFLEYPQKGLVPKIEIWLKNKLRYMLCIGPFLNAIDLELRDAFIEKHCPEWKHYVPRNTEKAAFEVHHLIVLVYDIIKTITSIKDSSYVKNK